MDCYDGCTERRNPPMGIIIDEGHYHGILEKSFADRLPRCSILVYIGVLVNRGHRCLLLEWSQQGIMKEW